MRDFINIKWQEGNPFVVGKNGAYLEEVLETIIDKVTVYQKGPCPCSENDLIIEKLSEALVIQRKRIADREKRGVLGSQTK